MNPAPTPPDLEDRKMKRNMLPIESGIRALVGMLLLASPLLGLHTSPYHLLGIVLIATGVPGYCPLKALGQRLVSERHQAPSHSATAHG
jgi:hypothetical protein